MWYWCCIHTCIHPMATKCLHKYPSARQLCQNRGSFLVKLNWTKNSPHDLSIILYNMVFKIDVTKLSLCLILMAGIMRQGEMILGMYRQSNSCNHDNMTYDVNLLCSSTEWLISLNIYTDSKVHGAYMGPIWEKQVPGGPHAGPMNFAVWVFFRKSRIDYYTFFSFHWSNTC